MSCVAALSKNSNLLVTDSRTFLATDVGVLDPGGALGGRCPPPICVGVLSRPRLRDRCRAAEPIGGGRPWLFIIWSYNICDGVGFSGWPPGVWNKSQVKRLFQMGDGERLSNDMICFQKGWLHEVLLKS